MQPIKKISDTDIKEGDVVRSFCKTCGKNTLFRINSVDENIRGICGKCREYYNLKKNENYIPPIVTQNIPKCPTCASTDLRKISTMSKIADTAMFGLLGTKRHKTFHCNNCGYEW